MNAKRKKRKSSSHKPDKFLLICVFSIVILGLLLVSSASVVVSKEHYDNSYGYFFHQLVYGLGIGLVVFFITQKLNYKIWKKTALLLFLISIGFLVLVFIPGLGVERGGAMRWVDLKVFSFQPSEVAKLGIIIFLSAWLAKKKDQVKKFSQIIPPFILFMGLVGALLLKQPDTSTFIVIVATGIILLFLARVRLTHMGILGLLGGAFLFFMIKSSLYKMNRILVFMNPDIDPLGIGYQIKQSLLAIGSGGIFGVGLGHSRQKYNYLPSPASDSIFAIGAEEWGFIGASILIILFIALAIRGLKIAKLSPDNFSYFTAAGISSWFIIQAFVNIAAITNIIPLTGITLPFISYGSSSLITCLAGAGILINISKHTKL